MAQDRGQDKWVDQGEVDFYEHITKNPTSPEALAHERELYSRMRDIIPPGKTPAPIEIESPEWFIATGAFWRKARIEERRQLVDVAAEIGVSSDAMRAIDAGMIRRQELAEGVLAKYAQALNKPDLHTTYTELFRSRDWHTKPEINFRDHSAIQVEPLVSNKDLKGLAGAVAFGIGVGVAGVAVGALARKIRGS